MTNKDKTINILNSQELANEKEVGVRYIVLECKKCHRHFGVTVNFGKISEEDMTCRNCKQ